MDPKLLKFKQNLNLKIREAVSGTAVTGSFCFFS